MKVFDWIAVEVYEKEQGRRPQISIVLLIDNQLVQKRKKFQNTGLKLTTKTIKLSHKFD